MCLLRFENNLLTMEGVRFASISKKTPLSKLSFAFVSLALPLLANTIRTGIWLAGAAWSSLTRFSSCCSEILHLAVTWVANNIRIGLWLAGAPLSSLTRFSSCCSESYIWLLRDWLITSELPYDWLTLPWVLWQDSQAAVLNPLSDCYMIG